ncbi:ribonuclease H [Corynebacterium renale]|uniref:ribonuclease HI n=1 Tax=Corynebacterium renale TaxID=1724 RepID=UPI000DA3AA5B|nr:RNase H family protein [Corynebacterium renale]SQG63963.1 ribonuclease H [Corynebacterium renale]STD03244.1 ribonuclease H [Corynebacterium renale]
MTHTIAVIRHTTVLDNHHIIVTAIDGDLAGVVVFESELSTQELLIDAFLSFWSTAHQNGATVYINDATVRHVLATSSLENLCVRDVVTGDMLRETDYVAHSALASVREDLQTATAHHEPRRDSLVVATDASRGSRRSTGIALATDHGVVQAHVIEASSSHEGEFAAVAMAVRRYAGKLSHLEILTDSRVVARALSGEDDRCHGPRRLECMELVRLAREHTTITVRWVRGHNGHVLNEVANRAAIAARRCHEFGTGNLGYFLEGLRAELRACLAGAEYVLAA